MLSVEILEALSGCKVTRPPEPAANANAASVAMHPRVDGNHEYVVSDEDAAAIKSKTMWLRSSYYRQPDQARVEKYRSRGFTLVADPAIP
jgi:predicted transcriptional regulator